jgi:hypothetical protein
LQVAESALASTAGEESPTDESTADAASSRPASPGPGDVLHPKKGIREAKAKPKKGAIRMSIRIHDVD